MRPTWDMPWRHRSLLSSIAERWNSTVPESHHLKAPADKRRMDLITLIEGELGLEKSKSGGSNGTQQWMRPLDWSVRRRGYVGKLSLSQWY